MSLEKNDMDLYQQGLWNSIGPKFLSESLGDNPSLIFTKKLLGYGQI